MPPMTDRSPRTAPAVDRLAEPVGAVLFTVVVLAVTTAGIAVVESAVGAGLNAAPLYLVAVVVVATRYRTAAGIATALASFAIYNLLFTEPRFTLIVSDLREWLDLVLFLFVAVAIGRLAGVGAARTAEAEGRARESAALYEISRTLATAGLGEALPRVVRRLVIDAGMERVWCTVDADGTERTMADSGEGDPGAAPPVVRSLTPGGGEPSWMRTHVGRTPVDRRPGGPIRYRIRLDADGHPVGTLWATRAPDRPEPSHEETRLLALAADQLGLAIQRDRLREQAVAAEVARRDDALKTALLDSVSHDLRTPLAGIRAAAGRLADPAQERGPEEVRSTAAVIEAETQRLDRLVGGLLDLSRIQAGSIRPNLEALDVEGMIRPVVQRLRPLLGARRVEVDVPPDLPPLAGDAVFVDQCLANLVENVARHTPPTASLAIRARLLPETPDESATAGTPSATAGTPSATAAMPAHVAPPPWIEVSVEDDGPGVDPEAARRLFDRFYRAGGTGRPGSGMGIGLTVVRGLTEAMGGTVEAGRGPRGGLLVSLRLRAMPLPGDDAGADQGTGAPPSAGTGPRDLISPRDPG